MAVGQEEEQQQQLPQAARPSTNVAVCVLREQPPPHKQRTDTTRLFSQPPTVGIELFVLLPAPGVEAWTKAAKTEKEMAPQVLALCSFVLCVCIQPPEHPGRCFFVVPEGLGFLFPVLTLEFPRVWNLRAQNLIRVICRPVAVTRAGS